MTIALNTLSGILLISLSLSCFLGFYFTWNIFLCFLILLDSHVASMYKAKQLSLLVLQEWPYVGDKVVNLVLAL